MEARQHPAGWDPVRFCHRTRWDLCLRSLHRFPPGTPYRAVEIVTTLALLAEQDKFLIARDLPFASEFHREMTNFRVDARGAASGAQLRGTSTNDLVMAVAPAAWFTVRQHPYLLDDAYALPPLALF